MKYWIGAAIVLIVAVGLALAPVNEYFFFAGYVVLTAVVLATAWNILGGYAGYVNFGTPAFFGIGAYTGVLLFKWLAAPLALQIAAGRALGRPARVRRRHAHAAPARHLLRHRHCRRRVHHGNADDQLALRRRRHRPAGAEAPGHRSFRDLHAHAVRGHGRHGDRRGLARALHPGV